MNARIQYKRIFVKILRRDCINILCADGQYVIAVVNRIIAAIEFCLRKIRCIAALHITDGDTVARRCSVGGDILGISAVDSPLDSASLDDDIIVIRRGLSPSTRNSDAVRPRLHCAIYGAARVCKLHLAVRRTARDGVRTIKRPCHRAAAHANSIFDCFVRPRLLNHALCMTAVEFPLHRAAVHLDNIVEYACLALAGIGIANEVDVVDGERIARHICGRHRLAARRNRSVHIRKPGTWLDQFADGEMIARYRAVQQIRSDNIAVGMRRRPVTSEARVIHLNRRTLVIR